MLKVLYFASFREKFGKADEEISASFATVEELVNNLATRGLEWQETLLDNAQMQVAVNQDVASLQTPLKIGDEVAFFPPVTGG